MAYLTREQILLSIPLLEADYEVGDGTKVRIRELMAEERIAAQEAGDLDPETRRFRNLGMFYAYIVRFGVIAEPSGDPLFTDADLPALARARTPILPRGVRIRNLGDAIWSLSEADPDSFRTSSTETDDVGNADADNRAGDGRGED
jgi:hypothetical protein